MTTASIHRIGEAILDALGDRTVLWLSDVTLIPRATLRRRLVDGNFTAAQLWAVADALSLDPADLMGAAA